MEIPPLQHQSQRARVEAAAYPTIRNTDLNLLARIPRVKVRRLMLIVIHGNNDSEKRLTSGTSVFYVVQSLCPCAPQSETTDNARNLLFTTNNNSILASLPLAFEVILGNHPHCLFWLKRDFVVEQPLHVQKNCGFVEEV